MTDMDFLEVNNIMWDRMRERTGQDGDKIIRWFFGWIFTLVLWIAWWQGPQDHLFEILGIEKK